jgi:hypothetical protein
MSRPRYFDRAMFHLCLFLAVRFPLTGKTAAFAWKYFLVMACLSLLMAITTQKGER